MTRLRRKGLRFKAEITVFVSLILMLILSLVGALMTSAAFYNKKSSTRAKMTLALESVFAEYDVDLLEEYDIFARANTDEQMLITRLQYYGITNVEHNLVKSELLTDNGGLPYYKSAIRYMRDWLGADAENEEWSFKDLIGNSGIDALEIETEERLEELLSLEQNTLLEEDNPLSVIQNLKKTSLLSLLVLDQNKISEKELTLAELPSQRILKTGAGEKTSQSEKTDMSEKILFAVYLQDHFSCGIEESGNQALDYELEYILCGKSSDRDNLENTLQKILLIRMGVNYAYLLTDEAKVGEANALAAVLCTLTTSPELIPVVKQALLLAWAYGESVVDLRVLMKQDKVPPLKTSDTWQLQLSKLIKLGTETELEEKTAENGLSYTDYLKGLLLLESREDLCMRSLDLIEKNTSLEVDCCMTGSVIESRNVLRENVVDTFKTEFFYQ